MPSPLISVVIFTRNAASTLDRALGSVCSPGSHRTEVLVLDGGSTDDTLTVVEKYRSGIAYVRSRPDGSPTNAINEGVERARGDVVCLLPGDDWLEPDALPFIANEFHEEPTLDVLTCGVRIVSIDAMGKPEVWAQYRDEPRLSFTLPNILRNPLTCARFIRK